MWADRHVVVGVTGGIACYKSCHLVRHLVESGAQVDVVLTRGAAEFVRPLTFEALSGRPVLSSLWEPDRALAHIQLGRDADLIIVAPATAHALARLAHGMADDFLTALVLATTKPVLLAPAMNDAMYAAAPTQDNLRRLIDRGMTIVGPDTGPLAEGPADRPGRMTEPDVIVRHAARLMRKSAAWSGRRVVVTAGPTREAIDPVRVVTNRSSGKMGYRIAEAAWFRGAEVTLLAGPGAEPDPDGVTVERIESTAELDAAVRRHLPAADVLVMAAAPADYRPVAPTDQKRPREQGTLTLEFEPTADILLGTKAVRKPGALIVGFALETGDAVAKAAAKLARKGLDLIVANDATEPGAGFEVDTNRVTLVDRDGGQQSVPLQSKGAVAEAILDAIEVRLG
ncbi:MAG: bifunctional phosphopantothenoylcysteine decarboxylase/phosphopantothenate--cysteine ligase CoaBC [Gemmatimonadales bacterium]|nr:bifunctional phosphopantothenoylcysteine decarboxylase/phosphopantothenate--cysteine ligase CoaBC [Gemmatimonadales bacterium]